MEPCGAFPRKCLFIYLFTDTRIYEIKDGEQTKVGRGWRGDSKPECTYVMKDGNSLAEYLSREPSSDESDLESDKMVQEAVSEVVPTVV
jgi:hypothetical protein